MAPQSFTLSLEQPATPIPVAAGATIVVRGSLYSHYDGSVVDAATTTWPADAPGGASVDAGGLIDFGAGGFELVARDATLHEVRVVATGKNAPACTLAQVEAPCLALRSTELAHSRLLGTDDWLASLRGELRVEGEDVLARAAIDTATLSAKLASAAAVLGIACGLVTAVMLGWRVFRRWASSARRRFARLVTRVDRAAANADPVLSSVLRPTLHSARQAVSERRIDPDSSEGRRLVVAFEQLHGRLCAEAARKRRDAERYVADELALEVEAAVDTAAELANI
jgi:hypothetical protein